MDEGQLKTVLELLAEAETLLADQDEHAAPLNFVRAAIQLLQPKTEE